MIRDSSVARDGKVDVVAVDYALDMDTMLIVDRHAFSVGLRSTRETTI